MNGSSVQSGSSTTYTSTAFNNGDVVTVDVTNANGCIATSSPVTVTVNAPPSGTLTVSPGKTFCAGTSVTFTATPSVGGTYTYNFKVNGGSVQSSNSPTYTTTTLTNGQVVTVDVTNSSGCTASFTPAITVTVNPVPTGTLTATENSGTPNDNTICAGSNVTFTATSGYSNYAFYLNGTGTALQNSSVNTYSTSSLATGNYLTVVVTNGSTCTATFTSPAITVVQPPSGTITPSATTICAGDNVDFTATAGFSNYNFKVNGVSIQNGASNTASYSGFTANATVTVDVSNSQTCASTFGPAAISQ